MKTEWLYGIHTISNYIENEPHKIKRAVISQSPSSKNIRRAEIEKQLAACGIKAQVMRSEKISQLTQNANHQGIAIEVLRASSSPTLEMFLNRLKQSREERHSLLILDRISDPQNLGSCFRSAHAAGMSALIATKWQSAPLTPTVRKIACGAAERLPFLAVSHLSEVLKKLKKENFFCIGLEAQAPCTLYGLEQRLSSIGNMALVVGNEQTGLREHVAKQCDILCKIPMHPDAESLNVGVAAAIACFELQRQDQYFRSKTQSSQA